MSRYTHTDKQGGDGLAITDWNNLSSAVAGSSGLTLALNPAHKVGIGTATPDGACKLDVDGIANSKGLRFQSQASAHIEADGALYRTGGQVYLTVDDNLYVRDMGSGNRFHFETNNGRLGVAATPEAPLSILGDGKEDRPNGAMHITSDCILFGGNNSGKETNSAQISAGKHQANSLNIVGMSSGTGHTDRKVTMWAEGGLQVHGNVTAAKFVGDGSGLTNLSSGSFSSSSFAGLRFDTQVGAHIEADGSLYRTGGQVYLTVDDNLYIRDAGSANRFHFNTNNGRLGVGTANPEAPLSIVGDGKEDHPNGAMHITSDCILFGGNNSGKEANSAQISAGRHVANSLNIVGMSSGTAHSDRKVDIWAEGGLTFRGSNNTWRMWLESNKLVFHIASSFHGPNRGMSWDGDTNWDAYSDRKLKTNIEAEEGILARLLRLEVKRYQWKDSEGDDPPKIGFIAQDVEPLFPELVGSITDPDSDETSLTLKYANFGVLAIGGLRELKSETDAVIASQKKSIKALQGRVRKLEKQLAQS